MASLIQFKNPISQLVTQSGTKVQKAICNCYPDNPLSLIPRVRRIPLVAKTGTVAKLITFGPNSKSKFAQAGYDQIVITKQPHVSGLVTNLISLYKKGRQVRNLWMEPNGKFSTCGNNINAAKKIGLSVK